MITPQTQIKLNLSVTLRDFLESKARRFGIPMSDYLKHLILRDIEGEEYPVFEPSEATIKASKQRPGKLGGLRPLEARLGVGHRGAAGVHHQDVMLDELACEGGVAIVLHHLGVVAPHYAHRAPYLARLDGV